eukprot:1336979-Pleurochrysis_carterae.AAC.3
MGRVRRAMLGLAEISALWTGEQGDEPPSGRQRGTARLRNGSGERTSLTSMYLAEPFGSRSSWCLRTTIPKNALKHVACSLKVDWAEPDRSLHAAASLQQRGYLLPPC